MSRSRLTLSSGKISFTSNLFAYRFVDEFTRYLGVLDQGVLSLLTRNKGTGEASDAAVARAPAVEAPNLCTIILKMWTVEVGVSESDSTLIDKP